MECCTRIAFLVSFLVFSVSVVRGVTDPKDLAVLNQFRKGLENAELLQWPANGDDPCGPPSWPHIYCSGNRVSQIQVRGLGLKGPLPENFNQLSMLSNIGLQQNQFSGKLPSFSGLAQLQYAYLDYNNFDTIPSDFFKGLVNLEVLALDYNPLNATTGWSLPSDLQGSAQLKNLTLMSCNLAGPLPEFLGNMSSLEVLKLSLNRLSGGIPESFRGSLLTILWLNQQSEGMTGPIDVVATMESLTSLWLHGNHFSGKIPDNIGAPCAPDVMALLEFLDGVNYPSRLVQSWSGNNPCQVSWLGIGCDPSGNIITINLPNYNLSGILSPSIVDLDSLTHIYLESNNLSGSIPTNWTSLKYLTLLNLGENNISPPLPRFSSNVKLVLEGNSLLNANPPGASPSGTNGTSDSRGSPSRPNSAGSTYEPTGGKHSNKLFVIVAPLASFALLGFLVLPVSIYFYKKKREGQPAPSSLVIHPRDPSDSDNTVKIVVADGTNRSASSLTTSGPASLNSSGSHVVEAGNLVISIQVLRNVTKNFAPENELGRGGFGVVYKGELDDGTKIAVKRMEAGIISSKALDEFRSEIAVLSKVRHRHLVSLLGYSIAGNERILVYECLSQGALSKHLFHWKKLQLEPLSWKRRLNIALDVARGMEYLHALAHQSFIHRDLKSSNILLGDDFRAKVSDFGLVKLAPDGEKSVVTRLAGTFGYLAPEYAVTGKITTKADVFSFGVVLMELLTGMMALDEDRPEESQYLVAWFWHIKSSKDKLMAAIDPALDTKEEKLESISIVAELAGHCTAREPNQRPDMGHAVNVLASLIEKWKPLDDDTEEYCGIDYSLPLNQMVKDWQEAESKDVSYMDLEDSKGSIPARPAGFAESFTSVDGRIIWATLLGRSLGCLLMLVRRSGDRLEKIRRKIGRKLPPPKNATNTEIKSKAIVLPEQSIASEKSGLAVSKKGLTLKELLQQSSHHNIKVRKDALLGIRDILLKHPAELKLHKLAIIEKLRERIGDDDKLVRETLYQLFKSVIFPGCAKDNQGPLVSLMMAYIFSAMTHLAIDDIPTHDILHAFEPEVAREPIGLTDISRKLKDLLPILSIDLIVGFLVSRICGSEPDPQVLPPYQKPDITTYDQFLSPVLLKKLWDVFPLNLVHLSGKDEDRIFMLNTVIAKVFLQLRNWDCSSFALLEKFLEFVESSLSTKAFTEVFKNCSPDSSMKLACLSAIEEMLAPERSWLYLHPGDPALVDYQIAWVQDLPLLLILLDDKNPLCSKAVLRLLLLVGQATPVNSPFSQEFDTLFSWHMLWPIHEAHSRYSGACHLLPLLFLFHGLPASAVSNLMLLMLCNTKFIHICACKSKLLLFLSSEGTCRTVGGDDLEPYLVLRILEVLHSAFRAGHIQFPDYASFHVTLLSRFHVYPENIGPAVKDDGKSNQRTFKYVTSIVCSFLSQIGDDSLVFQMLEKMIVDQICGETLMDNKCALLRLLITLDSRPTRLTDQSIVKISHVLPQYLTDTVSNVREGDHEEKRRRYYLLPSFYLFHGSKRLLSLVLNVMGSWVSKVSSSLGTHHHYPSVDRSTMVCSICSVLLHMYKDVKIRQILLTCEIEIGTMLQNLLNLLSSEGTNLTLEERHKIQTAYDQLSAITNNDVVGHP
ncbi:UNVERIFIED_CONTAM: Receptor protein kinase TMK1 [Sesamum calycinum]|uniref:Receptor protein kinase TMK1 n=1 Tax=Sesamum calycinum TaxID=2727403 RepID=A0AAW2NWE9_9LAMI